MKHGSLFSGIGGFDIASEWMGWKNKFHCEWDEFGQQILNYYWPEAKSYGNITETDFTIWNGKIDILTGGFPCQPYPQAGKRRGKEDERHLWPQMLRAIKEIESRWIVGENVYGIVNWNDGMVFEEVQAQLEDEGYQVQPYILPAAGVGAPHQRYRVWFVAYNSGNGCKRRNGKSNGNSEGKSNSKGIGERFRNEGIEYGSFGNATNTNSKRSGEIRTFPERSKKRKYANDTGQVGCHETERNASNASNQGLQRGEIKRRPEGSRQERDEQFAGCVCPGWEKFPTQSPVCCGNDGISELVDGITFPKWRRESIKGYGNAVVPQVVLQIFKAIEEYETKNNHSK